MTATHKLVPVEPTEVQQDKGEYVNSEWLNDNAPIGQSMYRAPAKAVYENMLAAAPNEGRVSRERLELAAGALWDLADDEVGWETAKADPKMQPQIEWVLTEARAVIAALGLELEGE